MKRLALPLTLLCGVALGAIGTSGAVAGDPLTFQCTSIPLPITGPMKLKKGQMKTQTLPAGWEPVGGGSGADQNGLFTTYVVACTME